MLIFTTDLNMNKLCIQYEKEEINKSGIVESTLAFVIEQYFSKYMTLRFSQPSIVLHSHLHITASLQ